MKWFVLVLLMCAWASADKGAKKDWINKHTDTFCTCIG
jgi:hypothetical protein